MDTTTHNHLIEQIGNTAGEVWRHLTENGPTTMAKLVKAMDEPRDLVMQALGWLAREDKLSIEEDGRTRVVSLKS
jgi:hypothetical protein